MLALDAHAVGGDPDERIEPEDRERELCDELRERVDTLDVRHLVHEHVAAALLGPVVGVVRQQHDGIDDAPRDRNIESPASQQRHRTRDAEPNRDPLREREPTAVFDALAAPRQSRDGERAGEKATENAERPDEPDDGRAP